jgi:hypothetical protein
MNYGWGQSPFMNDYDEIPERTGWKPVPPMPYFAPSGILPCYFFSLADRPGCHNIKHFPAPSKAAGGS